MTFASPLSTQDDLKMCLNKFCITSVYNIYYIIYFVWFNYNNIVIYHKYKLRLRKRINKLLCTQSRFIYEILLKFTHSNIIPQITEVRCARGGNVAHRIATSLHFLTSAGILLLLQQRQ